MWSIDTHSWALSEKNRKKINKNNKHESKNSGAASFLLKHFYCHKNINNNNNKNREFLPTMNAFCHLNIRFFHSSLRLCLAYLKFFQLIFLQNLTHALYCYTLTKPGISNTHNFSPLLTLIGSYCFYFWCCFVIFNNFFFFFEDNEQCNWLFFIFFFVLLLLFS